MTFSAEQPVWALINKSTQNYVGTKSGIKTFETRSDARQARSSNTEQVVRLSAAPASYKTAS